MIGARFDVTRGEVVPAYRLYQIDGAGKITNADWIAADSDEQAITHAHGRADGAWFELWERNRLVCQRGRESK